MLNFLRLAQRHHIPTLQGGHHHCKAGWIQTHCPFCAGGRQGWHLGYSLESGAWSCWRCGALAFWLVVPALLRVPEQQARRIVAEFQNKRQIIEREPVVRQRTIKPPGGAGPLLAAHTEYLTSRGFDAASVAAEWGALGTNHLGGEWAWRIVLPVHNGEGHVAAFQGRSIGDARPRYKMSEDKDCLEPPDTLLYGLHKVKGDAVLVVEGALKVIRMGAGAVGTLGIDWKRPQMNKLRRFKYRYILFDPEAKAQQRAGELAAALSLFPGTTEVLSGFAMAPDEFTAEQVVDVRCELALQPL